MIMQYRKDKNGNEISVLGYGCMRFTKEGGHADIDKAEKEVMAAIDAGVNYLDMRRRSGRSSRAIIAGNASTWQPSCRTT